MHPRVPPVVLLPALLLAAALLVPAASHAQAVRGRVVEAGTGTPVASAMVLLLDAGGARRSAVLADAAGRFSLRAPAPGVYRLRVERVGYPGTTTAPLELAAGATVERVIEAEARPITLEGIGVGGRGRGRGPGSRRCSAIGEGEPGTAALWEEARKALEATAQAQEERLVRYDLATWVRVRDAEDLEIRSEQREESSQVVGTPFASAPADTLMLAGFVRRQGDSTVWEAPDAPVLLSELFLAGHCFRVQPHADSAGLVGLAFRPVDSRRVSGVEGTLWLDRATAQLRFLEFRWVKLPLPYTPHRQVGGRVEFDRTAAGTWMVRRWWVRMPEVGRDVRRETGLPGSGLGAIRLGVLAIRERGGEVLASAVHHGPLGRGRIAGVAWDSTRNAPLAGAVIRITGGTGMPADSAGAFALEDVPEGRYTLVLTPPELAPPAIAPIVRQVEVRPGAETRAALALTRSAVAAKHCEKAPRNERQVVVFGRVTAEGEPVEGATVRFSWMALTGNSEVSERWAASNTSQRGVYAVCEVPAGASLRAAVRAGRRVQYANQQPSYEPARRIDFTLPPAQ